MRVLAATLQVSLLAFMIGSLAGVGFDLPPRRTMIALKDWRFVRVSLLASWAISPVIAFLLLQVVSLAEPYATGMILLALAPCAPFAPLMVRRAGGDVPYAVAFTIISTVVTAIIMPIGVPLVFGLSVHPWTIARPLLFFVLAPMAAAMWMAGTWPSLAQRVRRPLAVVSNLAGAVMLVLIVLLFGRRVVGAVGSYAIATQTLFLCIATMAADLSAARLPSAQRTVVTIGTWSRNLGAALAPLTAIRSDSTAMVMIVISALITISLSPLVLQRLARRSAPAELLPT